MSGQDAKAVYQRFVEEVINEGNVEVIPELFSSDYVDRTRPPGAPEGLAGVKMIPQMFRGAFPDVHFTIEDMVSEGDTVATSVTGRGTHQGPFLGIEPTGRQAAWASMGFFRVEDGKIAEHWGVPDLLTLMMQLGVIPAPPADPNAPGAVDTSTPEEKEQRAQLEAIEPDPEEGKRIMRHHVEDLFNKHDLSELDEWLAPGYCYHVLGQDIYGAEGYRSTVYPLWDAFPDTHNEIQQQVAEGELVSTLWKATGTHEAEFFGVPPTGKRIEIYGISIECIRGSKRLEGWGCPDMLGLMQQIGAVPSPEQSAGART
ncbi:MAG TPA: ester cyclase [Gaiellaceae bacterium]|nr:ester cyclase [Gaiellaceae bacterium]